MISVIITAYNEPHTIGDALDAIHEAVKNLNYEIIVCAPDTPTLNVAKQYNVKLIQDPGKGKPIALNLAFKKAKGEFLILTDGDVIIQDDAIEYLIQHFSDKIVGAVSSRVNYESPKNSIFYEWTDMTNKAFDRLRKREAEQNIFSHPTGYLYAIRRGLVTKIPEDSLSDDAVIGYMIKNLGYLINYENKAAVNVKFPTTVKDFIIQKRRTRMGFDQIKQRYNYEIRSMGSEIRNELLRLPKFYGINQPKMLLVGFIYLYAWLTSKYTPKKEFSKIWSRIESTK